MVLGAGVYMLVRNGVVIYVGKTRELWARVYAHRNVARRAAKGKAIPSWFPIKGFVFDQVLVRPCALEGLDVLEREMIALYRPKFNQSLKPAGKYARAPGLVVNGVVLGARGDASAFRRVL